MSEQQLPDTESLPVIQAAIAWEIASKAAGNAKITNSEEYKRYVVNTYIEVFNAIYNRQPLEEKK